jgi:hypothetical protein
MDKYPTSTHLVPSIIDSVRIYSHGLSKEAMTKTPSQLRSVRISNSAQPLDFLFDSDHHPLTTLDVG